MPVLLHITFRHIEPSTALDRHIRDQAEDLMQLSDRITSFRVVVEAPPSGQYHGQPWQIRIVITVPGSEIVVSHSPAFHHPAAQTENDRVEKHMEAEQEHKDVWLAVAGAFSAARRQLEDYTRVRRGEVKGRAVSIRELHPAT